MQYPYLISRLGDPIIAVSIGVAAYYLHEKRDGREESHRLHNLLLQKYKSGEPQASNNTK